MRERFGQDLDRDIPIELGIACPIDFAHPPATNFLDQGEDAKTGAGSERQVADYMGVEASGRRLLLPDGQVFTNPGSGLPGSPPAQIGKL